MIYYRLCISGPGRLSDSSHRRLQAKILCIRCKLWGSEMSARSRNKRRPAAEPGADPFFRTDKTLHQVTEDFTRTRSEKEMYRRSDTSERRMKRRKICVKICPLYNKRCSSFHIFYLQCFSIYIIY